MMRHGRILRLWIASAWLLAGCNIDTLLAEFYIVEATEGSTTAGSSSGTTAGSGSTGGSSSSSSTSHGDTTGIADSSAAPGSTGEATVSGSTGAPSAVCGDAKIEGEEECDDGNLDDVDACDNSCARSWTIFVTSEFQYSGNINGLVGADTRCRNRAANAELPRSLSYKALISDSTTDAAERLHHARGYYRLVNGLPVAHGWDALMTGPLENPVNVTESSLTANVSVWTGTAPGGVAVPGAEHCMDWKSESFLSMGYFGMSSEVGAGWLLDPDVTNPTACIPTAALYCVEQP